MIIIIIILAIIIIYNDYKTRSNVNNIWKTQICSVSFVHKKFVKHNMIILRDVLLGK